MPRKMLFKIGVTVVIGVGIFLFYSVHQETEKKFSHTFYGPQHVHGNDQPLITFHNDSDLDVPVKISNINSTLYKNIKHSLFQSSFKDDFVHSMPELHQGKSAISTHNRKEMSEMEVKHLSMEFVEQSKNQPVGSTVHLCVVACGNRTKEVLTMLKSAILTTPHTVAIVFHIISEEVNQNFFKEHLKFWPKAYRMSLSYKIYNITFPKSSSKDSWKKLFKPCAAQRLFLPSLLHSIDSLIYVDTDVLFLRSTADLWSYFSHFNTTQLVALVPESEDASTGWYNRFAMHPFYGELGVNSGVMLMNLTRLRRSAWHIEIPDLYNRYRLAIPWGDQDLINIYFAAHPDQLYVLDCEWNYRSDHCKYQSVCKTAEQYGVAILHGSKRAFVPDKQPAFATVFNMFYDYHLGDNFEYHFIKVLEEELKNTKPSVCGKISHLFLKHLRDVIKIENARLVSTISQETDMIDASVQRSNIIERDVSKTQPVTRNGTLKDLSNKNHSKKSKSGMHSFHHARGIAKVEDYSQYDDDSDLVKKVWDIDETH